MHVASRHGHKDVIFALADLGAGLNAKNKNGRTPVQVASDHGKRGAVNILEEFGSKPPRECVIS